MIAPLVTMRPQIADDARLRILHVGKYYPPAPGGMERVVQLLCEHERPAADSRVLACNTAARTVTERWNGVPVTRVARLASDRLGGRLPGVPPRLAPARGGSRGAARAEPARARRRLGRRSARASGRLVPQRGAPASLEVPPDVRALPAPGARSRGADCGLVAGPGRACGGASPVPRQVPRGALRDRRRHAGCHPGDRGESGGHPHGTPGADRPLCGKARALQGRVRAARGDERRPGNDGDRRPRPARRHAQGAGRPVGIRKSCGLRGRRGRCGTARVVPRVRRLRPAVNHEGGSIRHGPARGDGMRQARDQHGPPVRRSLGEPARHERSGGAAERRRRPR